MATIAIIRDPTCGACLEDADTIEHYLCECPAYARIRHRILGAGVVRMEDIRYRSLVEILQFIRTTKKFSY